MRVVFLEDVHGVAQGGDVKEVRDGFARNFLIPKKLAVPATHNALQRVERLKKQAQNVRLELMADMRSLAEALNGAQVNVEMRAGASGRLYGSVTNTIVAQELSKLAGREVDRRAVEIAEPIRQLGAYDMSLRLHPDVEASVRVLVYASGTSPTALEMEGPGVEEPGEAAEAQPSDDGPSVEAAAPEVSAEGSEPQ